MREKQQDIWLVSLDPRFTEEFGGRGLERGWLGPPFSLIEFTR